MRMRQVQLAAKHLRRHALVRSKRIEPREQANLDAPRSRLLDEVGGLRGHHGLEPTQEPRVGNAVEIAVVIKHLRG